jgi:hypothetical protein
MAIPPIRSHGNSGHLEDHNNIRSTISTHDSYLDQGVKTTDQPEFSGVNFGQVINSSSTININTNLSTVLDSFPISTYRSAEYIIQMNQGSKYMSVKCMIVHDDVNAGISEYGKIELGGEILYILSADVSGSNLVLTTSVTDGDVNSVTVKLYKVIIKI